MKKKLLTLVFTLVLLISLVAAMGMNASAATTYTARNRLSYVNTADNLWNYVAQSYTGDVIALSGNITYDDKNDADPYVLPFGAQGDMVLDLNGYTLDITTRADALVELDYGTTRLHIVNSRPDVPAKIIMRTKVGNSSMIDISKKECGVYVYEGVELVMGKEGDMAEAYRQTSVISATEFSDIAVYGGNLTNNIANGVGIVLESDDSLQFDNSTVTLHGGAKVTAKTSSIFLNNAYDYPTFNIGDAYLECDGRYHAAISNYIPASSASSQVKALTFANIVANGYSAYLTEGSGRLEGRIIGSSTKLLDYKTNGGLTFKLTGVTAVCNHNASTTLLNSFFGHYDVCTKCYKLRDASGEAKIVTHTYKEATSATSTAHGNTAGYDCYCGYKTIQTLHYYEEYAKAEPTCTEYGYKNTMYKCESCATYFDSNKNEISFKVFSQNRIDPLGHDMVKVDAKDATCTQDGNIAYYDCSRCDLITSDAEGKNVVTDTIIKAGHKLEKIGAQPAGFDIGNDGNIEHYSCSGCDTTYLDAEGKIQSDDIHIMPIDIVTLSTETYTYAGKVRTPNVMVEDTDGKKLVKDVDFKVEYAEGRKLPGKYAVKVTFIGNYYGEKTLYFTIIPRTTKTVSATATTTSITLNWSKVTGATGYRIYKYSSKTKKYDYYKSTSKTSLKVTGLSAGTTYKFKVRAYTKADSIIWGDYSDSYSYATLCAAPKVTATQTTTTITLKWAKVTGANGYRVYKYDTKTKKYVKLKDLKGTSLTVKGLKSGTGYKYKVRAYKKLNGTNFGAYSAEVATATKCLAPKITKLTSAKKGVANVVWSNVSGETGYDIYYSTSKNGTYKKLASVKANTVSATVSKLTSKKTYYFKIRAAKKTASGTVYSAWSAVKSVKIK